MTDTPTTSQTLAPPGGDVRGEGASRRDVWGWLALLLRLPIHAYRLLLSPLLPARCRFHPSCSAYALGALETHGPFRGSWLTVRRLCRCHPFHPGGVDPVPPLLPRAR